MADFKSGHYLATWNGVSIGTTREGFTLDEQHYEEIIRTDESGMARQDGIQMGVDVAVELDYVEYGKIAAALYGDTGGVVGSPMGSVGSLLSSLAKPLVLTPVAGHGLKSYTFYLAVVHGSIRTLLATRLRQGPVRFVCLPDAAHNNLAYVTGNVA
jgi:hypothetical protein